MKEFKANDESKEASKTGEKVLRKAPIVYVDILIPDTRDTVRLYKYMRQFLINICGSKFNKNATIYNTICIFISNCRDI